jgi:hypothetical protein
MLKTITALAATAVITASAVAISTPAEARWRGHGHWHGGGAVAAGVLGGLALGAIASGAYAYPRYYGGPGPYYGAAYYGPPCHWRRQRIWDGYGWIVRRVRVCY